MPTWLPWLVIALGLAFGVGLMIYNAVREEDDEEIDDGAHTETLVASERQGGDDPLARTADERLGALAGGAAKGGMFSLKQSFEDSLQTRADTKPAKDRMVMPWYMLVGPEGSGKTAMLENTGLPLPYGPALDVDLRRKDAGRWWLYEDAVVLEAPPAAPSAVDAALTLGKTLPPDRSEGWNTLLHMLRRERPDSPLNGIVITISCADLLEARRKPQLLEEQASRIRAFLDQTRRVLGVRLPFHVIVTKCDVLPGFRSFVGNLPISRRQDIFGWANDADIEAPFDPNWIENGFNAVRTSLDALRDEVLAAPEDLRDSDGLFVFIHEFPDVKEPLKSFITRLVPDGERRPSLFLRGVYFSGETTDATTTPDDEFAGKLVFVRSLFADKIFPEAGLARPYARMRLSRDRRVILAQAAAILFTVVGGLGLWTAVNGFHRGPAPIARSGLRADAETLARVLSGMVIDLDRLKRGIRNPDSLTERRTRDAAVIELVDEMRDVRSLQRSPFMPVSWFSSLPGEIRESMVAGIQEIVLPVIRQRLQERANGLLSSPDTSISHDLDTFDPRELTKYLTDVRTLSRNIARYNSLATEGSGSVADLAELLDYLFGERLHSDSGRILTSPDFERALRQARAPRILMSADRANDVLKRAVAMVSAVAGAASRQLAPRVNLQAELRVNPAADLVALRGLGAIVELAHPKRGLVATLSDSAILGVPLTPLIEDSIGAQLRLAAVRIARDTIAPDQQGQRLRTVLQNLFDLRFMERSAGRHVAGELRPNERLRWDVGRLELALTLRGEFDQAVVTVADAFPGQPPDRMRRALEVQLRSRAIDVAASAQRFTAVAPGSEVMLEARGSGANLEAASSRITRLAVLLDSLNAAGEGRKLVSAAARQAEQVLAMAQGVFDHQRYFAPQTARIAAWQGVIPVAFASLGVTDSISFETLAVQHLTAVRTLAHDVAPALRYLRLPAIDSTRLSKLVDDWEAIATSVAKYERGDPTSTLGGLHRFLREEMTARDLESCRAAVRPDTNQVSTDIFMLRRRQFRGAIASRCGNAAGDAVTRYQALRTLFTRTLAGRYPFADSTPAQRSPRVTDADPAAVREFFRAYDVFAVAGDVALRSDPRLSGPARAAIAFLDQMAQIRPFLSPMLNGGGRRIPQYSIVSAPADSTVYAELSIAGRSHALDVLGREERWQFGDSVSVVLEDSARTTTIFAAAGGWSALRLAQGTHQYVSLRFYHPDTKVELAFPASFPVTAPEIALPRPASTNRGARARGATR